MGLLVVSSPDNQTPALLDVAGLDTATPVEEQRFWEAFESELSNSDDSEARRHLGAGRAIYVEVEEYPGRVTRIHPDGRRELMRLDDTLGLVVERAI